MAYNEILNMYLNFFSIRPDQSQQVRTASKAKQNTGNNFCKMKAAAEPIRKYKLTR